MAEACRANASRILATRRRAKETTTMFPQLHESAVPDRDSAVAKRPAAASRLRAAA